jgi:ketosteroid isomerase-like protein
MPEDANVTALREAYRLWEETKGDSVDSWMALIDDDIEFGSLVDGRPEAQFARAHRGKAELMAYFAGLNDDWTMNFYKVHDFVSDGDRVVAIGRTAWTHKRSGVKVNTPKADCWWFADGRAVRFFEFLDTAALIDAAKAIDAVS